MYTSYLDDEKKQVLQIYGQRSDEVSSRHGNIMCDLPVDMENPALLVTGGSNYIYNCTRDPSVETTPAKMSLNVFPPVNFVLLLFCEKRTIPKKAHFCQFSWVDSLG